jgi:hypothetical protein
VGKLGKFNPTRAHIVNYQTHINLVDLPKFSRARIERRLIFWVDTLARDYY